MRKAEKIVAIMISELIVDGIKDRVFQRVYDLSYYNFKEVEVASGILRDTLRYAPLTVSKEFYTGNTLHGFIKITITWDDKIIEWGVKNEN